MISRILLFAFCSFLILFPYFAEADLNLSLPKSSFIPGNGQSTLPTLGDPTTNTISSVQDAIMGQKFMEELRHSMPILDDPIVTDYIQSLGHRLVGAAGTTHPFSFFVVNTADINAFAGPGGYVAVNSGLIIITQDESELASVMAHEIAHVINNDIAQKAAQAKRDKISMLAAMIAGVAAGAATNNAELSSGAVTAGMGAMITSELGFSRQAEETADQVGIQILAHAGFDPSAMADFFGRLANDEKFRLQPPAFASDHPLTADRIAYTVSLANQYPKMKDHSQLDYFLNRERVRVELTRGPAILDYYRRALTKSPNVAYLHYGYAIALLREGQYQAAKTQIEPLIQSDPDQWLYPMVLARIELGSNQPEKALAILDRLHGLYPEYYPLTLEYAYAQIRAKQTKAAKQLLRDQLVSHPDDIALYELLAKAYVNSNDDADAYLVRAQVLMLEGNPKKAQEQLEIALKTPNISPETRQEVLALLKTLNKKTK